MKSIVRTGYGQLQGVFEEGVHRFAGVPFAAPPIGELRFGAPQRPEAWSGVRPALEFGPIAIQMQQPSVDALFATFPTAEDCLTLNLWTPDPGAARLPVVVYIHGGGLIALSGADPLWHGDTFARDGVVLVTINYRLGALGYLYLDELVAGTKDTSCNGLLDQIAALQWVHENIDKFGGDPDCVTVMGQSAGAWSVSNLIASPLAKGLFHRVILESGGGHHVQSPATGTRVATKVLELAGIDADLDALIQVPVAQMLAAQGALQGLLARGSQEAVEILGDDVTLQMPFLPVIGCSAVPEVPHRAVAAGAGGDIDLLAGGCREEYGLYRLIGSASSVEQMLANAQRDLARAGRALSEAETLYRRNRPHTDDVLVAEAIETDRFFRIPVIRMAEGHSNGSGRTYMYDFVYSGSEYGACHCMELAFVFERPDSNLAKATMPSGVPVDLVHTMHDAWTGFAKTGRPDAPGLPSWPEFESTGRKTMILDDPSCEIQEDPRGDERSIWDGVL